jgi:hypothetical protein
MTEPFGHNDLIQDAAGPLTSPALKISGSAQPPDQPFRSYINRLFA